MKLRVDPSVWDEMVTASRRSAPREACGLCGGKDEHATRFYELTNADASAEHYRMLPEEQFAAIKDMRGRGLGLLAIWHSHPVTPARMSDEDLRLAYTPGAAYLVLSLASPRAPEIRGFTVRDGKAEPIDIAIARGQESEDP